MSFSNSIVWCLVCWVWWWHVTARAWDVCWWLLRLLACMSCCWSHCWCFFFLLDLCLSFLMLLHDLSWRCCFRQVASWCWCFWLKPCLSDPCWSFYDPVLILLLRLLIASLNDDRFLSWLSNDGLSEVLKLVCVDGTHIVEWCEKCSS